MFDLDAAKKDLEYNPTTGVFVWRVRRGKAHPGQTAGTLSPSGYVKIMVKGRMFMAHRLAWLYMTGDEPTDDIDHINGNRADNRWRNLRSATRSQNLANSRLSPRNKSGLKGVRKHHNRWVAQICFEGRFVYIGTFGTANEAHNAYVLKAKELFGEFARAA